MPVERDATEGLRQNPELDEDALRNLRVFFEILAEWVENDRQLEQTQQEVGQPEVGEYEPEAEGATPCRADNAERVCMRGLLGSTGRTTYRAR